MRKLILLLLAIASSAFGASADLSWTPPTQYTDGTAIPAGTLTQTAILYGICNATNDGLLTTPAPVTIAVPQPANTKTITGLGNGRWCFAARADTATAQSAFTSYVNKTIILTPNPPTGLTVSVQTAFMAVRQNDAYVMLPVGTIPGGTPCDSNNGVISAGKAYFAVPSKSVSWYGSTRPTVALATCS
jgi:hypothetical protein